MYLSELTTKEIRKATKLLKRKERMAERETLRRARHNEAMKALDAQIERIGIHRKKGRPRQAGATRPQRARTPRNALKEKIVAELRKAPEGGLTAREIAQRLKLNPNNVHAWFHATGKNVSGLQRSSEGRYTLSAAE